MPSSIGHNDRATSDSAGVRISDGPLLVTRARRALWIFAGANLILIATDILSSHGSRTLTIIHCQQIATALLGLLALRAMPRRRPAGLIVLTAMGAAYAGSVAAGLAADDVATSPIIVTAIALGASAFLPWSVRWQAGSAATFRPSCTAIPTAFARSSST